MGSALEAPTWPAITDAEAEAVLAHFPAAAEMEAVEWHSPRPFSAAALVRAEGGTFLLKRHHHRVRTAAGLAEEHRFVAYLHARGLSVPETLTTSRGASAVADGAWTYELQRRAPGLDLYRDRPSWTPFLSHAHAHAAGVALARLHLAARDFDAPARVPQPLVASFTILSAVDPILAAETYIAARPALAAFLHGRDGHRTLARLFAASGEGLSDRLAGQPSLWTHNDWHPSNLLWNTDGMVETVFDFGLATRTCALHDLATAIERTAFDWLALGEDDAGMAADAAAACALLDGYHEVLPLTPTDVETIARLLPLVHVEFALSEIDYFQGVVGDRADAERAWDEYLVGHAEWFLSSAGQDFLTRLREAPR